MRWMNPEPIIQSEVSQKEKDKYCISTHMDIPYQNMEFRKMVLKSYQQVSKRDPDFKEQTFGDSGGKKGWDDMREQH